MVSGRTPCLWGWALATGHTQAYGYFEPGRWCPCLPSCRAAAGAAVSWAWPRVRVQREAPSRTRPGTCAPGATLPSAGHPRRRPQGPRELRRPPCRGRDGTGRAGRSRRGRGEDAAAPADLRPQGPRHTRLPSARCSWLPAHRTRRRTDCSVARHNEKQPQPLQAPEEDGAAQTGGCPWLTRSRRH